MDLSNQLDWLLRRKMQDDLEQKRKPARAEKRPDVMREAHPHHIVGPVRQLPSRTDLSASADIHIRRERGELPTRAEARRRRGSGWRNIGRRVP